MEDIYQRLLELLTSTFGLDPESIEPTSTLSALELDSLALVELSVAAQEEFDVPLEDSDLGPESTVGQAAELISGKLATV
ncbi:MULTISPECIES: acyl carrier protein [Streptomyces]|uniref:Acyl carrier protein n=2 Tax=Streptomyces scopuliridis TaxID=452529 RepID=A0A2T7TAT0_9ACTN|nr:MULTISPECIES: phosphopantetheine-binding protein [Streptomyces]MCL7376941.1 phosphopantetheine-binding protein [Streptomyces sp. 35G-GA-8]PVE12191.1 acyl carrier protein [Streptomyces scopuliridis RB72]WSB37303.1 phosphopantetheine-binding protein [Streptomyces scopuliridis]WSC01919.1 phosphopantetheine-binding protein [Streptomyces scopuliridis]WSC04544.1 phosphopantetheine-binding protein [Streptomyces scopuliridis]